MSQVVGSRGKYEYITEYDSYNYNGTATVDAIVVHHWGVDGQVFENVINGLITSDQASAHYVLEHDRVACIIPPELRAWHVANNDYQQVMPGVYDINSHTIGIECHPECDASDIETLCQLIAELWCDYGVVPIYGHKEFMATACPGRYQILLGEITARAEVIYDNIVNGEDDEDMSKLTNDEVAWLKRKYAASQKLEASDWAKDELAEAVKAGITDGTNPQALATREQVACMILRATKTKK